MGRRAMKRAAALALLLSAGCSTAPIADLMDYFKPGKLSPETTPPYGGVCVPRPVGGVAANPVPPAFAGAPAPVPPGPAITPGGPAAVPPAPAPISPPPPMPV